MATLNTRIALRSDSSANWANNSSVILLKGEMGIEFDDSGNVKMKVGDGISTWAALPYFAGSDASTETAKPSQVFQADIEGEETDLEAINRVVGEAVVSEGDMAIVRATTAEKTFHTAYVYDNGAWAAMDGNYNAENVYFDEDLLTTVAVGNIELVNGQATIASTGKNLKEVWESIFVKEQNPETIDPAVSFTSATTGSYEVGTSVTPKCTVKLDPGSYSYGPETGITPSSWTVQLKNGSTVAQTRSSAFAEFDSIILSDGANYSYVATAAYEDGAMPLTNRGNEYADGQIKAGSDSETYSSKISSYRNTFYGTFTEKDTPTSENIRGLAGKSGRALSNGSSFTFDVPVGALRTVIAYPASLRDLTAVKDNNDSMSNIISSFTKMTVSVQGADGFSGIDYKVYYIDYANANDVANKYTVNI